MTLPVKILIVVPRNIDKRDIKVQKVAATEHQLRGQSADILIILAKSKYKNHIWDILRVIAASIHTNQIIERCL